MIRIAIVDDNPAFIQIIQSIIYQAKLDESFYIDVFNSGSEFIPRVDDYKLLLLDIDMPEMNGIEVVEKIIDSSIIVIYITGHIEYIESAFNINVFRFIKKDEIHTKLPEVLKLVFERIKLNQDIYWKTPDGLLGFKYRDIVYFEINDRKCFCYTKKRKYELINKKLSDIIKSLDDWFIQINRFQIINMRYFNSYNDNHFISSYNKAVNFPLSRNRRAFALKRYTERMLRDD